MIKILVDVGIDEPANGFMHRFPEESWSEKDMVEALSSVGRKPEDVDVLILTRLHFDHAATVNLFGKAEVYVQTDKWNFAHNHIPYMRTTYDPEVLDKIRSMSLKLVNGPEEILPGIRVIPLTRCIKGLQGVMVRAEIGDFLLLSSDHFYIYANINPPAGEEEILNLYGNKISLPTSILSLLPIGLQVDLSDWFESCFSVEKIVDKYKIIPGHDPTVAGKVFP